VIDPTEDDVGRSVVYLSGRDERQEGTISSFNSRYVFVRYARWNGGQTAAATRREDLEWSSTRKSE
jgi:hypothetical protein